MTLFSRKGGARPASGGARLGQHFLTNTATAEKIARESGATSGATILEVGPGKGILTRELLKLGAQVVAIEKDPEMVRVCTDTFTDEIASGQLRVIEGDARELLTQKFAALQLPAHYAVAANIPYYITGELIRLFLTAPTQPETVVLLIQKEVAERIACLPAGRRGKKKESILSLSVKAYGEPVYVGTVKAGSFNPPPKVDSAILKIQNISRDHFSEVSEESFFDLLHAGFGQKRKVLLGNLKRTYGEKVQDIWQAHALDAHIRAEDVPLETWLMLAQKL